MILQENLDAFTNSCIPIITKVKPVEGDGECESMDSIRTVLGEQLQKLIKNQFTQAGGPMKDMNMFSTPNPDDVDDEKMMNIYNQMEDVFAKFSNNCVMYDPLERTVPNEVLNEGMKQVDLVNQISELKRISGKNLHMNMDNKLYKEMQDMFNQHEQECISLASQYVEQTCRQAEDAEFKQFETEFCKHEMVRQYLSVLLFFANNSLIADAEEKYLRFYA